MNKEAMISIFLLSSFAASVSAQDAFDLLRKGDIPALKALIEKTPALATAKNADGQTLLHLAVYGKSPALIDFLIDKGAKTEEKDARFKTPLHLAAMNDRREVAAALLDAGFAPGAADRFGWTPLHYAARDGRTEAARILVERGAPIDARNIAGQTAYNVAQERKMDPAARLMAEKGADTSAARFPVLKGDYLGQKAPGLKPEIFAPGVVSTEKKELNSVFTPDGREFYFTIQEPPRGWTIMVMKREADIWTKPRPADFSGTWSDVDHFLSPDGRTMYFCSNRPLDGKGATQNNFDIWMVERRGDGWSEARNMGAPINSPENEFYPSVAKDGTMVFQSWRAGSAGGRDIYQSRLVDGAYKTAEGVGPPISTDLAEGDALISPDGDFIILSVERPDELGAGDLCVSFRGKDGSWSEPRNMGGEINTKANENCPIISPDGKFLFYTSAGDIYWVSVKIIDDLRPGRKEKT